MDYSLAKVVVPAIAFVVFVFGTVKGVFAIYRAALDVRDGVGELKGKVNLLMTNHLPHIQESLNEQDTAIEGIRSNVQQVSQKLADHVTRFEDTKKIVDTFNQSLIDTAVKSTMKKD